MLFALNLRLALAMTYLIYFVSLQKNNDNH
jgi:hypothetical protein